MADAVYRIVDALSDLRLAGILCLVKKCYTQVSVLNNAIRVSLSNGGNNG